MLNTMPLRPGRQLDTLEVIETEESGILRLAGRLPAEEGGGPEYVRTMTGCECVPVVVLVAVLGGPPLFV